MLRNGFVVMAKGLCLNGEFQWRKNSIKWCGHIFSVRETCSLLDLLTNDETSQIWTLIIVKEGERCGVLDVRVFSEGELLRTKNIERVKSLVRSIDFEVRSAWDGRLREMMVPFNRRIA